MSNTNNAPRRVGGAGAIPPQFRGGFGSISADEMFPFGIRPGLPGLATPINAIAGPSTAGVALGTDTAPIEIESEDDSQPVRAAGRRPVTANTHQFVSRERKLECLRIIQITCEEKRAGCPILACIRRFSTLDNLLTHLEQVTYCQASERIDLELQIAGEIDQSDVQRLGGVHPYESLNKNHPLNAQAGCYARSITLRLKSGEKKTFRYNGSAHDGLRSAQPSLGFCSRVNAYQSLDRQWKAIATGTADHDAVDSFLKARKRASTHGYAGWPLMDTRYDGEYDGAVVIKSAWWVSMAQSRLQVYQSVCGGDKKAGGLLLPLHLSDKEAFQDISELTFGWIQLMEAYQTLFSGAAPIEVNNLPVSTLAHLKRANKHKVWTKVSLPANKRLQVFEQGGQTGNSVTQKQYDRRLQSLVDESLTHKGRIKAYYAVQEQFQQLPGNRDAYTQLGLMDLSGSLNATTVLENSSKFIAHLQLVHHEASPGLISVVSKHPIPFVQFRPTKSASNIIVQSMFPQTTADFWASSIQTFLRRENPVCHNDAPSYKPNKNAPSVQPYVVLFGPKGAIYFKIEIFELDEYGLVKADGTGVKIIWYDALKRPIGIPLQRVHGEEATSAAYDTLAHACAVIRTALAVVRKNKIQAGFPLFLQKPAPLAREAPASAIKEIEVMPLDQELVDWGRDDLQLYLGEFETSSTERLPAIIWPVLQRGMVAVPPVDHGYVPLPFVPPTRLPKTPTYGYVEAMSHHVIRELPHLHTLRHVRPVLSQTWARQGNPGRTFINFGSHLECGLELHTLLDRAKDCFWTIFLDLTVSPVSEDRWRFHQAIELGLQKLTDLTIGRPAYIQVDGAPDGRPAYSIRLDCLAHPCGSASAYFQKQGYTERLVVVRGNPRDKTEVQRGPSFLFRLPDPIEIDSDYAPAAPIPLRPIHVEQLIGMDNDAQEKGIQDPARPADVENTFAIAGLGQELRKWMEMTMQGTDCSRIDFAQPILAYDLLLRQGVAPSSHMSEPHLIQLLQSLAILPWSAVSKQVQSSLLNIHGHQDPQLAVIPRERFECVLEVLPWSVARQLGLENIKYAQLNPRLWHAWKVALPAARAANHGPLLIVRSGDSFSVDEMIVVDEPNIAWECSLSDITRISLHPHVGADGVEHEDVTAIAFGSIRAEWDQSVVIQSPHREQVASELSRWCTSVETKQTPAIGDGDLDGLLDQLAQWDPEPLPRDDNREESMALLGVVRPGILERRGNTPTIPEEDSSEQGDRSIRTGQHRPRPPKRTKA